MAGPGCCGRVSDAGKEGDVVHEERWARRERPGCLWKTVCATATFGDARQGQAWGLPSTSPVQPQLPCEPSSTQRLSQLRKVFPLGTVKSGGRGAK